MDFKYEIELIGEFCKYLGTKSIDWKRELAPSFPYNKSKIDIVIRNKNELVGIEAKLKSFSAVLSQALGNRIFVPYNCILYPKYPSSKLIKKAAENGIGLFVYDKTLETFKIVLNPLKSSFTMQKYYIQIKNNWNNNKIGRLFSPKELPENFKHVKMFSENWERINYN